MPISPRYTSRTQSLDDGGAVTLFCALATSANNSTSSARLAVPRALLPVCLEPQPLAATIILASCHFTACLVHTAIQGVPESPHYACRCGADADSKDFCSSLLR